MKTVHILLLCKTENESHVILTRAKGGVADIFALQQKDHRFNFLLVTNGFLYILHSPKKMQD